MDHNTLPRKPDLDTGAPRPPRAPVLPGTSARGGSDPQTKCFFEPPPGQGPVLEWFKQSRVTALSAVAFGVGLCAVVLTFKAGGFRWVTVWWLWLIMAVFLVPTYVAIARQRVSAGSDWLMGRSAWVRTYELIGIKATRQWASIGLDLTDRDGRVLHISLRDVQPQSALWDLVYNGLLHSVHVHRAEINALARKTLDIEP